MLWAFAHTSSYGHMHSFLFGKYLGCVIMWILNRFLPFLIMCFLCVYVLCTYTWVLVCKEVRAGVTGGCEPPDKGSGNQTRSIGICAYPLIQPKNFNPFGSRRVFQSSNILLHPTCVWERILLVPCLLHYLVWVRDSNFSHSNRPVKIEVQHI